MLSKGPPPLWALILLSEERRLHLSPGCRKAVSLVRMPAPRTGEEGDLGEPQGNGGAVALGITRVLSPSSLWLLRGTSLLWELLWFPQLEFSLPPFSCFDRLHSSQVMCSSWC